VDDPFLVDMLVIDGNGFARIGPRTDKIIQQSFVLLERIRAELLQN